MLCRQLRSSSAKNMLLASTLTSPLRYLHDYTTHTTQTRQVLEYVWDKFCWNKNLNSGNTLKSGISGRLDRQRMDDG